MAENQENIPLENILVAQITALENNIERMTTLLQKLQALYQDDPQLAGKFKKGVRLEKQNLEQIKSVIQRPDVTQAQMEYGWDAFHKTKKQVQRVFTQCLDYIGGIAVRKWRLEEQICDMAETLVEKHLKQGANWGSVAIMGEDRLPDDVAQITQIIRLPFSEWDIWSLPFTAYEFGRWIAGDTWIEGLTDFLRDEPRRIQELIQLANVEELLKMGFLDTSDVSDGEIQNLEMTLEQLEASLKEFFADAFATYFLGPAYGYARVCLRLNPMTAFDHRSLDSQRMGIVLGMLELMNASAKSRGQDPFASGPYESEIKLLIELWEKSIQMTRPEFKTKFENGKLCHAWAELLYKKLEEPYEKDGFSPQNWKAAVAWGRAFMDNNVSTEAKSLPIILNAAWYGRIRKPNEVSSIERQARKQIEASVKRSVDAGSNLASDARSAESSAPSR